jgi:excisionase family DNA binding protein
MKTPASARLDLATAFATLLDVLEPVMVQWLAAALATAGAPGRSAPFPSKRGRADGPAAFTVAEAAKRARLSRSLLYNNIIAGNLIAHKAGARTLVLAADLDAFLAALPTLKPTLGTTDMSNGAAAAAPTVSKPVDRARADEGERRTGAAGDRSGTKRDEPRHVDRDDDDDGAAGGERRRARLGAMHGVPNNTDDARRTGIQQHRHRRAATRRLAPANSGEPL